MRFSGSILKKCRQFALVGPRRFAITCDILPSRYLEIENGKVLPSEEELVRIEREVKKFNHHKW